MNPTSARASLFAFLLALFFALALLFALALTIALAAAALAAATLAAALAASLALAASFPLTFLFALTITHLGHSLLLRMNNARRCFLFRRTRNAECCTHGHARLPSAPQQESDSEGLRSRFPGCLCLAATGLRYRRSASTALSVPGCK